MNYFYNIITVSNKTNRNNNLITLKKKLNNNDYLLLTINCNK
jgi:hypothetical protein